MLESIYKKALGQSFDALHPLLKKKYAARTGVIEAKGEMKQIRGSFMYKPIAYVLTRDDFLFPERGKRVPFTIKNVFQGTPQTVSWDRLFYFKRKVRRFYAKMYWDELTGRVVDDLGKSGRFIQPLHLQVTERGGLLITSEQTYVKLFGRKWRLPKVLSAKVNVYEEAISDKNFRIFVHITVIGTALMYEGTARTVYNEVH